MNQRYQHILRIRAWRRFICQVEEVTAAEERKPGQAEKADNDEEIDTRAGTRADEVRCDNSI